MFVLMLFFDFFTTRTTIGRRIYALGGNEKAARLSGIKTNA
jgi:putative multiple sugar transport system permease protein